MRTETAPVGMVPADSFADLLVCRSLSKRSLGRKHSCNFKMK